MKDGFDHQWESRLHRELKRLPDLKAPGSLLPGILAAAEAKGLQPWWRRDFWAWPLAARWVFTIALAATAVFLMRTGYGLVSALGTGWPAARLKSEIALIPDFIHPASLLVHALFAAGRSARQPLLACALMTYLMSVGLGTMLLQVSTKSRRLNHA